MQSDAGRGPSPERKPSSSLDPEPVADDVRGRRVLALCPFPPRLDGHDGGSRAVAHVLAGLAGRHRLILLCLRAPDEPPVSPELAAQLEQVIEVRRAVPPESARTRVRLLARRALHALGGRPAWALHVRSGAFAAALRRASAVHQPELVHVCFQVMAQYLPRAVADRPAVLVAYEAATDAARDHARRGRGARRVLRALDVRAWARFETAALEAVEVAVVLTDRDRRSLEALGTSTPVRTVPLGVDIPPDPLDPLGAEPPSVLFVGNYVHPPNAAAAESLLTRIMPAVRARHPGAELVLLGPNPPAWLLGAARDPLVHVTGLVPDVRPYLDRAAVVVAPLWSGGGMRVKVLEALAAGKAVLASPRAAEGLAVVDGRDLRLAEDEDAFASALADLLGDPQARVRLGRGARAWAVAHLGWDEAVRGVEASWQEALVRRQRKSASR